MSKVAGKDLSRTQLATAIQKEIQAHGADAFKEFNAAHDTDDKDSEGFKKFKEFIGMLLYQKAHVSKEVIIKYKLLDDAAMKHYRQAVRDPSVSANENYDAYTQLGDESMQKVLDDFLVQRNPDLMYHHKANDILTKVKNWVYDNIPFIDALVIKDSSLKHFIHYREIPYKRSIAGVETQHLYTMSQNMSRFAFFGLLGAIEHVIDSRLKRNLGYFAVQRICVGILSKYPIEMQMSEVVGPVQKLDILSKKNNLSFRWDKEKTDATSHNLTTFMLATLSGPSFEQSFRSEQIDGDEYLGKTQIALQALAFLKTKGIEFYSYQTQEDPSLYYYRFSTSNYNALVDHIVDIINTRGKFQCSRQELVDRNDTDVFNMIRRAFTHPTTGIKINNYELYEKLGDKSYNKVITQYTLRKFPELFKERLVLKKLLEVDKRYHGRDEASKMSQELGLLEYLQYDETKFHTPESLVKLNTDIFESFLYLVEKLVNIKFMIPFGYCVVYNILSSLLDEIGISARLTDNMPESQKIKEVINSVSGGIMTILESGAVKVVLSAEVEAAKRWRPNEKGYPQKLFNNLEEVKYFTENTLRLRWTEDGIVKI